jgi:membrane protein DedA with SNARE-associated domain
MAVEREMVWLSLMLGTFASEDLTCITAGLLVREGRVGAAAAVLACTAGIVVGDVGLWSIGAAARRVRRYPAWLARRLQAARTAAAAESLQARAPLAILTSRFLPGTRLPLYVGAGLAGVPLRTFTLWVSLAALAWTPLVVLSTVWVGLAVMLLLAVRFAWRRTPWEFWPMWLFYAPLLPWLGLLAMRFKGFSTITAANPGIADGGTVGESKYDILMALEPGAIVPSALIARGEVGTRLAVLDDVMAERGWNWPLVLKPDVGQRGLGVRLVRTPGEAADYLRRHGGPTLAQPYHRGPFEAGVFYCRWPHEPRGRIFSITDKHFPAVVGDGRSSIAALIGAHPRYRRQASMFLERLGTRAAERPAAGETVPLGIAGNHAQGAMFTNGWHLWTAALEARVDAVARSLPGFCIGRFDVRYSDVEAFKAGTDLAIVELNGATAESTDIYDPANTLLGAYRRLFEQWWLVFAIGAANRSAGAPVTPLPRLVRLVWRHLRS